MFEITVNIKAPELTQAILALVGAMGAQASAAQVAVATESGKSAPSEKPKRERTRREEPTQPPASQNEPDDGADAQQPEAGTADDANPVQSDIPSVVDLRAKAQEVGKTPEAKKAIKALLDQFGAKSISDIPEDKRADFLAELDLV